MRLRMRRAGMLLLLAGPCSAAHLTRSAQQEFENYAAAVERRLAQQHSNPDTYLAVFNLGPAERGDAQSQLRSGSLRVEAVNGGAHEVDGGLLHHWRGTAFVPGGKSKDMVALLQDFNHLASYYAPEVESSHVLPDHAGATTVAMRMKKQKVVTVVLDSEYQVHTQLTGISGNSVSRSTHIWEIANAGTADERRLPEGNDDGLLWRLNSYWSFIEVPDGLLIECEAISLTRDVPTGLAWLITPIIENMPRESLAFTLGATRSALSSNGLQGTSR